VTPVAFHVQVPDKMGYTCRLLRKAVSRGSRLTVTADAPTLAELDHALWLFSATDFVPHCFDTAPGSMLDRSPVVLSTTVQALHGPDPSMILVNLGHDVPAGFAGFARVIEVVSDDAQDLRLARQRWKQYLNAGITPVKHELGAPTP